MKTIFLGDGNAFIRTHDISYDLIVLRQLFFKSKSFLRAYDVLQYWNYNVRVLFPCVPALFPSNLRPLRRLDE